MIFTPYLLPMFFLFWGTGYFADDPKPEGEMRIEPVYIEPIQVEHIEPICITNALIQVESAGEDSAYNASEDAVGCLQIRKCMVKDVNRILRRQKSDIRFIYDDRWLRNKSIKMFDIYCKHYGLTTSEEIARCWNGGPRGMQNEMTAGYWKKVKNQLDG